MLGKTVTAGVVFIFISVGLFAGKIDKAYEALNVFDYFKAKSLFESSLKREPTAASYGLSMIYYRNDNPFHNLDNAYMYIENAELTYGEASKKKKEFLLKFYIDSLQISKHKNDVISALWGEVKGSRNIIVINDFIDDYPSYEDIDDVKKSRNDLAFELADSVGSIQSYREFYTTYPDDPRAKKAKSEYEEMLFEEKAGNGSLQSYVDFVNTYPDNSFVVEARRKIYELSTEDQTLESYNRFRKNFPDNPYVAEAWKNIFILSFTDFNDNEMHEFIENYHEFPYPDMLTESRVMRDLDLHRVVIKGKWGYVDSKGEVRINPEYEFENDFSNEMALVANEDYVGYINKKGEKVIDFIYDDGTDFIEGVAHVVKGDSIALIDKRGREILGFNYSYISTPNNGVILVKQSVSKKYIFHNLNGEKLFNGAEFDYAEEFSNGFSIVGKHMVTGDVNDSVTDSLADDAEIVKQILYGVIDSTGNIVLPLEYKRILKGYDKQFRVMNSESKYGLISLPKLDTVISYKYRYIGEESEGKYAVFSGEKYGYRKLDGEKITSDRFYRFKGDTVETKYCRGYAKTKYRGKYGVVDSLGKKVFPDIFEEVGEVVDFPVPVSKRGKWGYVTKDVSLWTSYIYDYASAFDNGVAIVSRKSKYGVIDKRRKNVIGFDFDYLEKLGDGHYLAKKNNLYGLLDEDGTIVLPFYYSKIELYRGSMLRLYIFGEYQYFDLNTNSFIYGVLPKDEDKKE
ncbi:MAG: WG repeat-containing protein [Bacteroidota bacterium]